MKKTNITALSLLIAASIAASSLSGCENKSNKKEDISISVEKINENKIVSNEKKEIDYDSILSTEVVYNVEDILDRLIDIYTKDGRNYKEILANDSKNSLTYASALLIKAYSYGISKESLLQELSSIMTYSISFTDFDIEVWQDLFHNLLGTINEYENVCEYYYPLARVVHLYSCEFNHTKECGLETCEGLEEALADEEECAWYLSYVYEAVMNSKDEKIIGAYNRIYYSSVNINEALAELTTLYIESMDPKDYDSYTWNQYYGNLLKTIGEEESLYDTYYDLAIFVHKLDCDYIHRVDENGQTVCDLKKVLNI